MIPTLPNLRYEKKFVAEGFTLAEVLAMVQRHPSAFREAYPSRTVNNIYLDSPTRRDYHDHINGAANRSKTRVRWYGRQSTLPERSILERKLKSGMMSGKQAHPLPPLSINAASLRSSLMAAFNEAALPPLWHSALRHLEPCLLNRYRRHYFQSLNGRFRLTVDSELQYAGITHHRRLAISYAPAASTAVIELKFEPQYAPEADFVTNTLHFRLARFSKYVTGIERT